MKAITISGLPGTGTSTLATRLKELLQTPLVNSGQLFRELAAEHDMPLLEFGEFVKSHPEIDKELDARQVEFARKGDIILEGRLAGWNLYLAGVESLRILIKAPLEVRAERVTERDHMEKEALQVAIRKREEIDAARYLKVYGIDLFSQEPYHLIIDNGGQSVEETMAAILQGLKEHIPGLKVLDLGGELK